MRLIDRIIKLLVTFKFKHDPEWLATSYSINETTDINVIVETWRASDTYTAGHNERDTEVTE